MKKDISVIIPFYKGRMFLEGCLTMLYEMEKYSANRHISAEFIIVDDDPSNPLEGDEINKVRNIRIIRNRTNIGIHKSRVEGLKSASGEFVVFLDQDDRLTCNALVSQMKHIVGGDIGVVCNGYVLNSRQTIRRKIFCDASPIESINDREVMIAGNQILSPGQVMLKKECIPEIWEKSELESQGADDYLLWLLILCGENRFSLNPDCLFYYNKHIGNRSDNLKEMEISRESVFRILYEKNYIDYEENEKRKKNDILCMKKNLYKYYMVNILLETWLEKELDGRHICDWMKKKNIESVAIHGMGALGMALYNSLKNEQDVSTVFFVDRQASRYELDIPVVSVDEVLERRMDKDVDLIIIAVGEQNSSVFKFWIDNGITNVVLINDIINEI